MRGPVMCHPGGLFGGSPFPLFPPSLPPTLIGCGSPVHPPRHHPHQLPPLANFRCHGIPFATAHPSPYALPPQLNPMALSLSGRRSFIIKPKMFGAAYRPVPYTTAALSLPFAKSAEYQKNGVSSKTRGRKLPVSSKRAKVSETNKDNASLNSLVRSEFPKQSGLAVSSKHPSINNNNILEGKEQTGDKDNESAHATKRGEEDGASTSSPSFSSLIPSELTKPLFCELCEAKLNSPLQATSHYEGKNHAKKVRFYLERLHEKSGIKGPATSSNTTSKIETSNKKNVLEEEYCKLCDVAFTSVVQAAQHHKGRNHQRRLRGENPLPKGFFNPNTGKWQRQPPSNALCSFPKNLRQQRHYSSKTIQNKKGTKVAKELVSSPKQQQQPSQSVPA